MGSRSEAHIQMIEGSSIEVLDLDWNKIAWGKSARLKSDSGPH